MNGLTFLSRLTVWAFAGAAVGLLVGLLLLVLDVVENPFWLMAVGIGAAAVLVPVTARSGDRHD
jgi:hypothetical protein